jgi:hypothetical protein
MSTFSCPSLYSETLHTHTDSFTSEEVILKAIDSLKDKNRNISAAISVLEKRLHYVRGLSQDITPKEAARLRSLRDYYNDIKTIDEGNNSGMSPQAVGNPSSE